MKKATFCQVLAGDLIRREVCKVGAVKGLSMEVSGRKKAKSMREEAGKDYVFIQVVQLLL